MLQMPVSSLQMTPRATDRTLHWPSWWLTWLIINDSHWKLRFTLPPIKILNLTQILTLILFSPKVGHQKNWGLMILSHSLQGPHVPRTSNIEYWHEILTNEKWMLNLLVLYVNSYCFGVKTIAFIFTNFMCCSILWNSHIFFSDFFSLIVLGNVLINSKTN